MRLAAPAAAALLLATACRPAPGPPPPRPDLVLIVVDSLRPDHLGCYGYGRATSPRIDRLAAEGVRFSAAVSTTSWTLPAHAALFTGRTDPAHGVVDNGQRLPEAAATLAESLRDAGYATAGFFGGPFLHPTYGLAQGFDAYVNCMAPETGRGADEVRERAMRERGNPSHADVTGPRTRAAVAEWLGRAGAGPAFLFVHLWDVHYDYRPPPAYVEAFDPGYAGPVTGQDVTSDPAIRPDMPARDLRRLRALYDAEIRATDDVVGGILDDLDRHGRLDGAVVVLTADHGEEFFEHGRFGHQQALYEESVRIPLLVRAPGRARAGAVVERQARITDLMPTLLAMAGVPPPEGMQGRDLGPLLAGRGLPPAPAHLELAVTGRPRLSAVRTERRKLIERREGLFPTAEFFDLGRDPGERRPLRPRGLAYLLDRARLARLEEDARRGSWPAGEAAEPDAELVRRLRGLGYLGGGEEPDGGSAASRRTNR